MNYTAGLPETVERTCCPLPFRMLFLCLLLLMLGMTVTVSAKVITISPDNSIQSAIDSAEPGDTIMLKPGTYREHDIEITKNIAIQASTPTRNNAAATIIDANNSGRIFNNRGGHTFVIDNLTLRNGQSSGDGGALYSELGSVTITTTTFENCSAANGGAITANRGTLRMTSSSFDNCSAVQWEGGAIQTSDCIFSSTSSSFSHCSALYGGAMHLLGGTSTITSSTFSDSEALFGGAILAVNGHVVITNTTFSDLFAERFGGAISTENPDMILSDSLFVNCSKPSRYGDVPTGGVIDARGGLLVIKSSTITNCLGWDGGAIYSSKGTIAIISSTISNCSANRNGGVIYMTDGSTVTIDGSSRITNSSARHSGHGVLVNNGTVNVPLSPFPNLSGREGRGDQCY